MTLNVKYVKCVSTWKVLDVEVNFQTVLQNPMDVVPSGFGFVFHHVPSEERIQGLLAHFTSSGVCCKRKPISLEHLTSRRKEGNVLFNDALNTFYLQLYGIRHIVEDHSDSERENPLAPHGLLFPISSKVFFIRAIP